MRTHCFLSANLKGNGKELKTRGFIDLGIGSTSFEELIRMTARAKSKERFKLNSKLFTGYVENDSGKN